MSMSSMQPRLPALVLAAVLAAPGFSGEQADAVNGQVVFEQLCGICHAVTADGSGPSMGPGLFGLLGRKVATEPNYAMYTDALKAYDEKWDVRTLDEFLKSPMTRVPGTSMPVMLPNDKERADVIAYLGSLK